MGIRKKLEQNLKKDKQEEIELKPVKIEEDWEGLKQVKKEEDWEGLIQVKKEEDWEGLNSEKKDYWEEDINIINKYIEAIEKNSNILPILNEKQYNYILNNYEIGKWSSKKLKKVFMRKRYDQIELGKNIEIKHSHSGPINSLAIETIENKYMLSVGIDANIFLYDLDDKQDNNEHSNFNNTNINNNNNLKVIKPMVSANREDKHKYSITNICWYPIDNGMYTTSSMDHSIKVWDTNFMKPIFSFKFDGPVYNHAFSPIAQTHNLIATGSTSSFVILCDLRSGSQSHILRGHKNPVVGLDWSPSNEYLLASGSGDHTIRLWDIRKPKSCLTSLCQNNSGDKIDNVTAHNGTVNGLKFLSDSSQILSVGNDNKIHLWNIGGGINMNTMLNFGNELINQYEKVIFPAVTDLSECQPLLFQPSNDNDILVYDLYEAKLIKRLKGHFESVNCVVIRNGYQELYSCGNDSEIIQWEPYEGNKEEEKENQEEENNWSDDED
jgi:DNA excision repair protein ERCC-8